jgi:hypothetical protein
MAKKKKEETIQDILDRMQEDIDLISDKAIEMQDEIDSAEDIEDDDIDESDED